MDLRITADIGMYYMEFTLKYRKSIIWWNH